MKKKFTFFKTLLVAAGLLVGSSAWAEAGDVTTNADIDFSNAITDDAVAGTVNSMTIGSGAIARNGDTGWLSVYDATCTVTIPEAQRAGTKDIVKIQFKTAWGNKNGMGFGFNLKDAEGTALAEYRYARWDGSSTNSNTLNINMSGLVGGHVSNKPIAARYTLFDITINYAARTITSVVYCNNTDGKGTTATQTFNASLTNTNPIATFNIFGYGVGDNTDRASIFDDLIITTTEGDYSVLTYDYTINWKCGDDIIKSVTRQGEKDAAIALFDEDKAAFTESGQKYFYVSDDAEEKTVAEDGSTVVTVTIRQAETWSYTVNAVDESDNILGVITTGTVVEGNDIYYYYPVFYLNGTNLLQADINDKSYGKGGTPTTNDFVYNVTYKDKSISNVVFYQECEEIEGLTAVSAGNVPVRCSNGKGAMASQATTIATLAPGKYKISGFAWGSSGTVFTLTANETTVATLTTVSSTVNVSTSEEFTLASTCDIVLGAQGNGGSSPKVIDFIYIQKTGDAETVSAAISSAGFATLYTPYALDFSDVEGLTAYTATVSGNTVTLTAVDDVPANTGVVLKGDAKTYSIPVIASSETAKGDLAGSATDNLAYEDFDSGYTYYILTKDGDADAQFNPVSGGTITAGKAYLKIADGGSGAKLRVVFADDATAIKTIAVDAAESTAIYNLSGQRVNAAYKGIVIKNGKKYLNK